jgi:phage terminase large subunit GpA-like protein
MPFAAPLSVAAAMIVMAVGTDFAPPADVSISAWVEEGHVMLSARTGSPLAQDGPVPFSFDKVEYLREPLDRLHPDDPCTRLAVRGGAQSAKSSIGQLWVAWSIVNRPAGFAIGLPSAGEIGKYDDVKLAPIIEESPELRRRVKPVSTKSSEGSSTKKKRLLTGATIALFNLASPKELQMISAGNLILEEVGNALKEVGSRGAPVKQARERQAAYSVIGSKEAMLSTPAELGDCEITKAEEAGDQRRFYGQCQQCQGHFTLTPEGFKSGTRGGTPHHFVCPPDAGGCGGVLEESDMPAFRQAGFWLPSFSSDEAANPAPPAFIDVQDIETWLLPKSNHTAYREASRDCEGREPSYYIWQAMCGLISWAKIAGTISDAVTPADLKALEQQVYGRAWDPSVEAMAWEDLHRIAEPYDPKYVPSRAGLLTAFCDVQGKWLEWGVIAWGPGGEWWVIDRDVIMGDTAGPEVWLELDEVTRRTYPHEDGGELSVDWGLDTGYQTQKAYSFCRGRPNVTALDGQAGWKKPIFGKGKAQKIIEHGRVKGRVKVHPTGTWELKSLLMWSLKISVEAGYQTPLQGRGHWSKREDEAWALQITAEGLAEEEDKRTNEIKRWWRKLRERNEWVDIWVGARALAFNRGVGAPKKDGTGEAADWAALAAERNPTAPQADLFTAPKAHAVRIPDASSPASPPEKPRRFFRKRT